MSDASDRDAVEWVETQLARLDQTARKDWRHNVLGTTLTATLADLPRRPALCLRMPRDQYVIALNAGRRHGWGPTSLLRNTLATFLVADGVPPQALDWLLQDGTWR